MSKKTHQNISRIVICPRCNDEIDWKLKYKPSRGWVCKYCREELGLRDEASNFASRPMNDLEERRLDEDWDGELENMPTNNKTA